MSDRDASKTVDDARGETPQQRSDRDWGEILQELRVTQTGSQILSGFLLAVAFQVRFTQLDAFEYVVYGVLVALAAISTILGLAIVSLHRAQFHRHHKAEVVVLGNRLLRVTVTVVGILSAGVVLLIFDVVFGRTAGLIAGSAAVVVLVVLLLAVPRVIPPGTPDQA
jgi:hypothetical protein